MSKATAPTADFWNGVDPEIAEFERGLLESIAQAKRGEGRVTKQNGCPFVALFPVVVNEMRKFHA